MSFSCLASRPEHGYSLSELLVVLSLLAVCLQWALPSWQMWQTKQDIWSVRERLRLDLQSARVQAMQLARPLSLQPTRDCAWHSQAASDWSCGWQLMDPADNRSVQTTVLSQPVSVSFTKNMPLEISAEGDLGQIGERWTVQPRTSQAASAAAQSLCLSGAGRVRAVAGLTCS